MKNLNVARIHHRIENIVIKLDTTESQLSQVTKAIIKLRRDLIGAHKYRDEINSALDLKLEAQDKLASRKARLTVVANGLAGLADNILDKVPEEEFAKMQEEWRKRSQLRGRITSHHLIKKVLARVNGPSTFTNKPKFEGKLA